MKKNLFKISLCSLAILLMIGFWGYNSQSNNISASNLPVNSLDGDFLINPNEPTEVVGVSDYVFTAKIENIVTTEYRHEVDIETEDGYKKISVPYTNYKITVIDNIKGKLKKNEIINITKAGGISKAQESIIMYENDTLPEAGKYYIITAFAQEDGTLLISGPKSNILLDNQNKSEITSSKEYKNYKEYYDNEKKISRERFQSKYSE